MKDNSTSIRRGSSSSTRPPRTPRWRAFTVVRPGGERCRAAVPHGHWKTTTFTAGLRHDGIAAPMVLDGPMNGEAFLAETTAFPKPGRKIG